MKKILFFVLILGLSFALFTFGQVKNKTDVLKYKPQKIEIKVPSIPERKLTKEFKELDDFVRRNISKYSSSEFFMLLPHKKAVGQGRVESFDSEKLVLNSNGFKTTWTVIADTTFLGSKNLRKLAQATPTPASTTSLQVGQKVKILGKWDGQNLLAKRIISLEPVKDKKVPLPIKDEYKQVSLEEQQLNKFVERLQKDLQRGDIQRDLILMKKFLEFLGMREICVPVTSPLKEAQLNKLIEKLHERFQKDLIRAGVDIYLREFSGNKQVCVAAIISL